MELAEEDLIGRCGMGTGTDNTFELFWCKGVERKEGLAGEGGGVKVFLKDGSCSL